MNGYDFDKTIYSKDSSIEFYFYLIKKYPKNIYKLLSFIIIYILYKLKIKSKIYAKENMFSILKNIKNIDKEVQLFWSTRKLENWYLKEHKSNDIVISASPLFLIEPMCKKNNITNIIATNMNKKTGKIIGNNCYGIEKLNRYKKEMKNKKLESFYSDSKSDEYMKEVSNNFYIVR